MSPKVAPLCCLLGQLLTDPTSSASHNNGEDFWNSSLSSLLLSIVP